MDFTRRAQQSELMDDETLTPAVFHAVLSDLAQVNIVTRAAAPTLHWLARAAQGRSHVTVLDVGFGHGDMLRRIAHWARARRLAVTLIGIDRDPRSAAIATAATDPALGISYHTGDAASLAMQPDCIISSLVAHHMRDEELVDFLRWMDDTATRGWFINDLHRHRLAWLGYRALAALARWHPIVQHDGALSVRRAFTRADWDRLLAAAGLTQPPVWVRWHLPFRWGVGCIR
ncbi:MAG: methyltransferase domain-containing protein [Gemmatimonadaceae bacterium]